MTRRMGRRSVTRSPMGPRWPSSRVMVSEEALLVGMLMGVVGGCSLLKVMVEWGCLSSEMVSVQCAHRAAAGSRCAVVANRVVFCGRL